MRKCSLEKIFSDFLAEIGWYNVFIERAMLARHIVATQREKYEVLEAFVLKVHAAWSVFAENLFVGCLNRDASNYAGYFGLELPRNISKDQCRAMLQGLSYLNLRSVSEMKTWAKRILVPRYNPFGKISSRVDNLVEDFNTIRDCIAHRSASSRRKLDRMYRNRYRLRKCPTPGDFLFTTDRRTHQARFANYMNAFEHATVAMALHLDLKEPADAKAIRSSLVLPPAS